MSLVSAIRSGWNRRFGFGGRSSRFEYWWSLAVFVPFFALAASGLVYVVAHVIHGVDRFGDGLAALEAHLDSFVFFIGVFTVNLLMLPTAARRFHDCGWRARWFRFAAWLNLAFGLAFLAVVGVVLVAGEATLLTTFEGWIYLLAIIPYSSVLLTVWIGFVRPEPGPNQYGPNPQEVTQ